MTIKKVNQYHCGYCKKKNYSAPHMKKHEISCTMRPDRICRMCKILGETQAPMAELLAILPNPEDFKETAIFNEYTNSWMNCERYEFPDGDMDNWLKQLRDKTHNCPACILAAIRQKGIPVYCFKNFNFTEECKAWWGEFNGRMREDDNINYY
jgi:hypothetical protein